MWISSNSYITFGGNSTAFSGLGPSNPALPTIHIGSQNNFLNQLWVGNVTSMSLLGCYRWVTGHPQILPHNRRLLVSCCWSLLAVRGYTKQQHKARGTGTLRRTCIESSCLDCSSWFLDGPLPLEIRNACRIQQLPTIHYS